MPLKSFFGFFCIFVANFLFSQTTNDVEIQKGIEFYQKGDFEKAKLQFDDLLKKKLNSEEKIQIFNNLGNIFADQGKNTEALSNYQKALKLAKENDKKIDEGKVLKNIGALYVSWKKFSDAENYYFKALKLGEKYQDYKLIADCYNNLGTVYEQTNELEKAKKSYFKALEFYQKQNSDFDIAMVYSNLAIVFKTEGKVDKSIEYNVLALDFAKKGEDLWMSAAVSNNIGNAYSEKRDFTNAEKYCREAIQLSQDIKAIEITIMAYESLAEMFEKKGDFRQAYFYSKKMIALNNEFLNSNQTQQFSELEVKFKIKEKELENQKLNFEKRQIEKQNYLNISIFSFVFALILLIVTFYFRAKRQKILFQKQKELNNAVLESESKERFRIARDLHDSVGQLLSVIKMHLSNVPENNALGELVDKTITEVRAISHNLIPEALNFGLKRALEELVEKTQLNGKVKIDMDFAIEKAQIHLSKERELMLFRIIQELLGNTLKHAQASEIELKIKEIGGEIELLFSENGIGFDVKKIASSEGLGWKNTYARLSLLNGEIEISSQKNKGSNIKITLPNA